MKKHFYLLLIVFLLLGFKSHSKEKRTKNLVQVSMDLQQVKDDKITVHIKFPKINKSFVIFKLPKTVPGTYSTDNYGQLIEDFKAFDAKGNKLSSEKIDENSWKIVSAQHLHSVTYQVSDTYDIIGEANVFSPSGTNIEKDRNFMLNLHGFVGYLDFFKESPYQVEIKRPSFLYPGTALDFNSSANTDAVVDLFRMDRYFELTDNPIMYAAPDTLSFKTGGIEILLHLYSANGKYKANDIRPALVRTISAQKKFLGPNDTTKKYAVLLYLSDDNRPDARGYGALEHHNSTVVVFSENMELDKLENALTDVVSHEFFHILTPLSVHSKEIHYFDYNNPKMSKHLWMYEGLTEYFAQLFQINQGLCSERHFLDVMADKINVSKEFNDTVPFTRLSERILTDEYKNNFYNVYQKGALINMCLDIQLRELSGGKSGMLDLMQQLGKRYGKNKPFVDDKIFEEITKHTYPQIGYFLQAYVNGPNPLPYKQILEKVGLDYVSKEVQTSYFFKSSLPYVDLDPDKGEIYFRKTQLNSFLLGLGIQGGDVLKEINGEPITIDNYRTPILATKDWKPGQEITIAIERNGKDIVFKGTTVQPTEEVFEILEKSNPSKEALALRKAWLKG